MTVRYNQLRSSVRHWSLSAILAVALAAPVQGAVAQEVDPDDAAAQAQGAQPEAEETGGADIVVTGSYLNIRQEDRASPVLSITADDLSRTGVNSLADLTRYIPQNIGSAGGIQDLAKGGGADSRDTRSANLRGLGSGATLVLLNGRRVVPLDGFVNLNSLTPEIAISRIDTVLDGASSTYGADAVAGVLNVITDTRFSGLRVAGQYTHIADSPAYNLQAMFGVGNERFHTVTSLTYRDVDRLQNGDRAVTDFFNPSSGAGANPGSFVLYGRPVSATGGDVIINGNNYSTLYDRFRNANGTLTVVDPECGSEATQSRYVPAANSPGFGLGACQFSFQAQNPIRPASQSWLVHNDTTFELAEGHTLFAELAFYHQEAQRYGVPSFAQNRNGPLPPIVPAENPFNPFGVDVGFIGRAIGSQGFAGTQFKIQRDTVDQRHFVLGARGRISSNWNYNANVTWSRGEVHVNDKDTDMRLFQAGLDGFGGPNCNIRFNGPGSGAQPGVGNCLWLSPFGADSQTQDPSLIFNIQTDEFSTTIREYLIGEAVVNGTLIEIAGRPLDVAAGAQYRRELQISRFSDLFKNGFGAFNGPFRDQDLRREVKSLFAEANIEPVDGLNVNAAARYEDYGNFDALTPKIAVNWRVFEQLSLRGSASKAFQAPAIANSTASLIATNVANIIDPLDGSLVFRSIQQFGNPELQPQKADVFNIGATLLPVAGARLSIDYWNYKYANQIQLENGQAVINADPNGPKVIRDASGVAQSVIVTSYNAPSGTQTSGIDVAGQFNFDIGAFSIGLRDNLSILLKYDVDTGRVVYDGVGTRNNYQTSPLTAAAAPRFRNVAGIDVSTGSHSFNLDWRYVSSIRDDYQQVLGAPEVARIGAWSVFDWQYNFTFGAADQFTLGAGMINLFNKEPPRAIYTGFLSSVADPFGRQTYVRLVATF
ncbi:TonB-dependent receptor plug domain-containing protein [Sphingomonas sp. CJ99]